MTMIKKLAGGVALSALLLASAPAFAQETTSALRGAVINEATSAPVAGARVTIVHQPSGTTSTVTTDASGTFDARGLRVGGPYLITVEGTGFEPERLEDINLQLGETTRLDIGVAEPGNTVDEIVVTAAAKDPTAENTGLASVLAAEDVEAVVSVSRDIRDLARRNLLVSQNTRGDGGISIAGSNPRTNRVSIDGNQTQDEFGLNTGGLPTRRGPISLEAIEQFSVNAVPTDVQNGDFTGGALDAVLKSGENDLHGAAFVNYLNDGMVGDSIRGRPVGQPVTQQNYGAFLSGPILQDRLFFSASYENYESAQSTQTGPEGAGFSNAVRGITQADIDNVIGVFNNVYAADFPALGIPRNTPVLDEKYHVKLDWNINDNHRLTLTNIYSLSEVIQPTNINTTSAGLQSQWYLTGEEIYNYSGQLNSDWTDNFSTEIRLTHRDYERRQDPPSGQEFADVTVCNAPTSINATGNTLTNCGPTSVIRFGPDQNRHANFLETGVTSLQLQGTYSLSDHLFKFGYQGQKTDIFNIFVPNSDGTYYFDSVDDFRNGRANRLIYTNAPSGDANDAAADFIYYVHSLYGQDTVDLSETLRLTVGARFDWYKSDDRPANNPNFFARQGFSNQETYDGRSVFMPRANVEWEPTDWLDVRAGAGLFSGGVPDVFISNSFSNTGVLSTGVQIERTANGGFLETGQNPLFTPAIGAAALNLNVADPRTFYDIPAAVQALQGGAIIPPTAETNAILPAFAIPADWKFFLSTSVEAPEGWASGFAPTWAQPLLNNWRVNFDAVYTRVEEGLNFRDFRATPLLVNGVQQFTPDGRIRYDGIGGTAAQRAAAGITSINPGSNRDIVASNTDEGRGYTVAVSLSRSFDNGIDLLLGYAYQDLEDKISGARFASTANSLYSTGAAGLDPNEEAYGTGFEEVKHRFKAEAGFSRNLFEDFGLRNERFEDLNTRFNLFAEVRSGRPISFVMNDPASGRGSTFGVNRGNHLLYVPDFRNDANPNDLNVGFVTFDNAATLANFRNAVELFGLPQGRIVEKGEGSDDNPEIYQVDLQIAQDLPGALRGHKTQLIFDIQNVLNLLNDEWGIIEEYGNPETRLISAACATSTGAAAATGSPACDRYLYSNFNPTSTTKTTDTAGRSLWAIQVRLRYQF
jgi:hypothetical protein